MEGCSNCKHHKTYLKKYGGDLNLRNTCSAGYIHTNKMWWKNWHNKSKIAIPPLCYQKNNVILVPIDNIIGNIDKMIKILDEEFINI